MLRPDPPPQATGPEEEEELEGTHSIAMAAAQERDDMEAQAFLDASLTVPPPPPPPPQLSPNVLLRIASNRAAALERRRARAQQAREKRRVPVSLEGLFAPAFEPPPPQLVQSDLHRWFKLALDGS